MKTKIMVIGFVCIILFSAGCVSNVKESEDTFRGTSGRSDIRVEIQNVRSEVSDEGGIYGFNPVANVGYDLYIKNVGDGDTSWVSVSVSIIDSEGNVLDSQAVETRGISAGGYIRKHMLWKRSLSDLGHQIVGVFKKDRDYSFHIEIDDVNWEGKKY